MLKTNIARSIALVEDITVLHGTVVGASGAFGGFCTQSIVTQKQRGFEVGLPSCCDWRGPQASIVALSHVLHVDEVFALYRHEAHVHG